MKHVFLNNDFDYDYVCNMGLTAWTLAHTCDVPFYVKPANGRIASNIGFNIARCGSLQSIQHFSGYSFSEIKTNTSD